MIRWNFHHKSSHANGANGPIPRKFINSYSRYSVLEEYSSIRKIRVNFFFHLGVSIILLALAACGTSTPTPLAPEDLPTVAPQVTAEAALPTVVPTAADPLAFFLPTPGAEPVTAWRPPLYPSPWAPSLYDHFYFARPIAADEVNWPLPSYRYAGVLEGDTGNTAHTGVDISVSFGTVVMAAGPGTVVWSGWGYSSGDPANKDDPYGKAIVIRHDFGYQDKPLFTIYAHLSDTAAVEGQWVNTGDKIGYVGETGYTTGPHLHFEVRVGTNGFFATRNPELWMVPPQGWGVLVARIMNTVKEPLGYYAVVLHSEATGESFLARTYGAGTINPDAYYRENLVLSDLPAGLYRLQIPFAGFPNETEIQILPGQVTYITFQGFYGFDPTLPATPVNEFFVTPSP